MRYKIFYSRQFSKDLKYLQKNNPKKINQIIRIIKKIESKPFHHTLKIKKLKGEKYTYRYKISRNLRLLLEIKNTTITFQKIRKRENFY